MLRIPLLPLFCLAAGLFAWLPADQASARSGEVAAATSPRPGETSSNAPPHAAAASPDASFPPKAPSGSGFTLLAYFENDLFYNQDRYYTNAVQLRLISPDLRTLMDNPLLPEGVNDLLVDVPFPGSRSATQYNLSVGFGQHIYTPQDTQAKNPDPDDRPYSGYLYGLIGLHAKRHNRLDTLEMALGIVGPSALGEQAQNEVHRIKGVDTAKGWSHQLHDEPTLMLTWSRVWRLNPEASGGWGADFLPRVGLSAGTPFTYASLGGEARFGWNLPPDYGSSTIRPGSGINAPAGDEVKARPPRGDAFFDNVSGYLFVGCEGRAVAYNTFLDGNLWRDSRSVDKFPLVGEVSGGIAMNIHEARLTYTHVYRTDEFHGQDTGQNFGSITLGYDF